MTPLTPERIAELRVKLDAHKCNDSNFNEFVGGTECSCKAVGPLLAEIERLREALTSIASLDEPKHRHEGFWRGFPNYELAKVIARDTQIAREALEIKIAEDKQ